MIYFTSDLHLGHAKAIEFTNRPFSDVDEMNEALLRNINETVTEKDDLWILGDFAYGIGREEVRKFRNMIRCRQVHLINGNHDRNYSKDHIFQSVQDYKELKTERLFCFIILYMNGMQGIMELYIYMDISILPGIIMRQI